MYSRLGLISFYDAFCDSSVPNAYEGELDARQLRIRDFLEFILVGVESGEIHISGDIESVRQYIKLVDQGQAYQWEWQAGEEKPQYKKTGATAFPEILRLEVFSLEQTQVDPVLLLQWLRIRQDRATFLKENINCSASTGSNKDTRRIGETRRACESVRAEIEQGQHGFRVNGEYRTNQGHFIKSVQALLGDEKIHRRTMREEWAKVPENIKHLGRVPDQ